MVLASGISRFRRVNKHLPWLVIQHMISMTSDTLALKHGWESELWLNIRLRDNRVTTLGHANNKFTQLKRLLLAL